MPPIIRLSENSQSTGSDRTPSEHTDDEFTGVRHGEDSLSTGSQVAADFSDDFADEFVHVRHVRADRARAKVRRESRAAYNEHDEPDDIDPSDSASRPATSRHSSTQRRPGDFPRDSSRRRNLAPEPPPPRQTRRGTDSRVPREHPRQERPLRPESFHSESLDHNDFPQYGGGGYGYRPGPEQWGHIPHYDTYEPTMLSQPMGRDYGDPMSYRDPMYADHPFAPRGIDDFYDPRPPAPRPRPANHRYSTGPGDYGALMRFPSREQYAYDPYYRDYYGRRMPPPPEMREPSPLKAEPPKAPTPSAVPAASPSPSDQRLEKLEALILAQTMENRRRLEAKEALRQEEERKKKMAEEQTQSDKLIALEKLLMKQNEEAIAREKAMEAQRIAAEATALAKIAREQAEKTAKDKIDKELKEAAAKAKTAAEADAAAKAAEMKEKADKELAELKEKHEAAEAAKKAVEEEVEKLKPKKADPPVRFKDAVGRKFSFPFDVCKSWKGMENLIKQAFMHVDLLGPHVMEGHYDLIGPDGEIILPQVWETMIKPDYYIEMQMWPIPELEKKAGHGSHGHGMPGGPAGPLPSVEELLKGIRLGGGAAGGAAKGKGKQGKASKGAKIPIPPMLGGGIIPPPPMGANIPGMPPGAGPLPPGLMLGMPPGGLPPNRAAMEAALATFKAEEAKKGKKKSKQGSAGLANWFAGGGGGGRKK